MVICTLAIVPRATTETPSVRQRLSTKLRNVASRASAEGSSSDAVKVAVAVDTVVVAVALRPLGEPKAIALAPVPPAVAEAGEMTVAVIEAVAVATGDVVAAPTATTDRPQITTQHTLDEGAEAAQHNDVRTHPACVLDFSLCEGVLLVF